MAIKSFKSFLAESKTWTRADFVSCLHSEGRRTPQEFLERRIDSVIKYLNAYAGAAAIPNPDYNAFKDVFNAFVDSVMAFSEPMLDKHIRDSIQRSNLVQSLYYDCHARTGFEVPGKLKKAETIAKQGKNDADVIAITSWMLPCLRELAPVQAILADLKTKVVKRQPKAPEDVHAKYIAPMGSMESGKLIMDALKETSQRIYDGVRKSLIDYYLEQVKHLNAMSVEEQARHISEDMFKLPIWKPVGEVVIISTGYYAKMRRQKLELQSNHRPAIEKHATRQADEMRDAFVGKNAKKLVSILDAKRAPLQEKPVILSARGVRGGKFECELRVTFADGSQFDVQNQVVIKQNQYGTVFMQYPTTFHNVKLPNGKAMSSPSEERMNTVFAKA